MAGYTRFIRRKPVNVNAGRTGLDGEKMPAQWVPNVAEELRGYFAAAVPCPTEVATWR